MKNNLIWVIVEFLCAIGKSRIAKVWLSELVCYEKAAQKPKFLFGVAFAVASSDGTLIGRSRCWDLLSTSVASRFVW